MRFFSSLFLLIAFASVSEPPASEEPERTTYFLVDASGTMRGLLPDAQAVIAAKITLLPDDTEKKIIYFGGKDLSSDIPIGCAEDTPLSAPLSIQGSSIEFPELGGQNDKTAIGHALHKLLRTQQLVGHVVLVTDGRDDCNSDFLGIRSQFPLVEIEVEQIGTKQNPALELLEVKPQSIVLYSIPRNDPTCMKCEQPSRFEWSDADGEERFLWLWGVVALVAGAMVWALRNLRVAGLYESRTEDLRKQKRESNGGDLTLDQLREHYEKTKNSTEVWVTVVVYTVISIIGSLGAFLLWSLVFGSGGAGSVPFSVSADLNVARNAAWMVLGSPFAIAFSVLASAPLLFAFSQYRRRIESIRTYFIEVDSAGIAENRRLKAKQEKQYLQYKKMHNDVMLTRIENPEILRDDIEEIDQLADNLAGLKDKAKHFAQKKLLPESSSEEEVLAELDRLDKYTQNRYSYTFEEYLKMLEDDEVLSPTWIELRQHLFSKQYTLAIDTISNIAGES